MRFTHIRTVAISEKCELENTFSIAIINLLGLRLKNIISNISMKANEEK